MNPVQQKISCVYKIDVLDQLSNKRQHQTFRVAATRELNSPNLADKLSSAKATEKIDGTCCLVTEFQGKPWLWARHDRKPSKVGERRFAQYKTTKAKLCKESGDNKPGLKPFEWDPVKDFKDVPEHWIPALCLEVKDGVVMPDDIGHTPGWVPVQKHNRQHCWHLEAVDFSSGTALILREDDHPAPTLLNNLVVKSVALSELMNQTCELIGTNINGNPYGIGSKKNPVHMLVQHGAISLSCPNPCDFDAMWEWMATSDAPDEETVATNLVEGVVWHCQNGQMFKLHRHHLNLKWPIEESKLSQRQVRVEVPSDPVSVDGSGHDDNGEAGMDSRKSDDDAGNNMIRRIVHLNGQVFDSLKLIGDSLVDV